MLNIGKVLENFSNYVMKIIVVPKKKPKRKIYYKLANVASMKN